MSPRLGRVMSEGGGGGMNPEEGGDRTTKDRSQEDSRSVGGGRRCEDPEF